MIPTPSTTPPTMISATMPGDRLPLFALAGGIGVVAVEGAEVGAAVVELVPVEVAFGASAEGTADV